MRGILVATAGLALTLGACAQDVTGPGARASALATLGGSEPGAVYVESNAASGNAVLVFARSADGTLTAAGSHPTGGTGTGAGLGSAGAVAVTVGGQWLLAVNAGSNDVSVFRVTAGGLDLTDRVASGGTQPISVTVSGSLVYVLNAGGTGNISGFRLSTAGRLSPLAGSTRSLGGAAVQPAQVSFSPDGEVLVVTEKATNAIATYTVGSDGLASAPMLHASSGATPFGFAFAHRTLVVSEAGPSAASSYRVGGDGSLNLVTGSLGTNQVAACWVATTPNGRFAYTINAGSASVTGYAVGSDGALTRLDASGQTGLAPAGSHPIDADFSRNGRYLYVLAENANDITVFAAAADGSLTHVQDMAGVPASAAGLIAN